MGWDCHAHLFGPYDRFPLAPDRSYTPPEAPAQQYLALLERLNLSNGVLVHPSAYGEDYALLFDALAANRNLRGVIVTGRRSALNLKILRGRGVRAARFSHRSGPAANFAGSASFDDLLALAPRLADARLHAELWTDCSVLPDIAEPLRALPVPLVIDHMGGFDVNAGGTNNRTPAPVSARLRAARESWWRCRALRGRRGVARVPCSRGSSSREIAD